MRFPEEEKTIHCDVKETPSNSNSSSRRSPCFFDFVLKESNSHVSFANNLQSIFRIDDVIPTYFTSRHENEASLPFCLFSIGLGTSFSGKLLRLRFFAKSSQIVNSRSLFYTRKASVLSFTRKRLLSMLRAPFLKSFRALAISSWLEAMPSKHSD